MISVGQQKRNHAALLSFSLREGGNEGEYDL